MLATLNDVAAELEVDSVHDLTDAQISRAGSLLVRASHLFRQAAGRQFTPDTYTHRLQVVGGRVRLPESPVTQINSVVNDAGNAVEYTRSGPWLTMIVPRGHWNTFDCYHPDDFGSSDAGWFVTVSYTGGEVPNVVTVTVAQMVARHLNADPAPATGVKSQSVTTGPFSQQTQFLDWADEAMVLSDADRQVAESFRYRATRPIVNCPSS